jgi:hypothetical protein
VFQSYYLTDKHVFIKYYHRIRHLRLSIWPRNQTTNFSMETADIQTTQGNSHIEITYQENPHYSLRYQVHCSLWIHSTRPNRNQASYMEILKQLHEAACRKRTEFCPNDWILDHCNAAAYNVLSLKPRVSGLKINSWNWTPILFPWFGSEWLLVDSKNKICPKGTKISGYWNIQNNMTKPLKAIPQQKFQNTFQQRQHFWSKCIAAQL